MNKLHEMADDEDDLEDLLKGLGKGIGDVTVNIFLRELRSVWANANPVPSELVILAAINLGLIRQDEEPLRALKDIWSIHKIAGKDLSDFEAALLRLGRISVGSKSATYAQWGWNVGVKKRLINLSYSFNWWIRCA